MSKTMTKANTRSYPVLEPCAVDQQVFGPVDPIAQVNKRMLITVVGLLLLLLASFAGNGVQFYYSRVQPVRVLTINEAGQVDSFTLHFSGFTLHQAETQAALRKSITDWLEGFASRIRTPVNGEVATRAFPRSLLFLSNELAQAYTRRELLEHTVSGFMSSTDPEYRVAVTNVVFRNLEKKPYEADLYYDKLYYSQPLTIAARKSYLRTIRFTVNPADADLNQWRQRAGSDLETLLKTNPLVLAVTQAGDEQQFAPSSTTPQQ